MLSQLLGGGVRLRTASSNACFYGGLHEYVRRIFFKKTQEMLRAQCEAECGLNCVLVAEVSDVAWYVCILSLGQAIASTATSVLSRAVSATIAAAEGILDRLTQSAVRAVLVSLLTNCAEVLSLPITTAHGSRRNNISSSFGVIIEILEILM